MRRLLAVLVLMGGLALAGCSQPTTPAPTPTGSSTPTSSAPTSEAGLITPISATRSGGLAGRQQILDVSADGSWTYGGRGSSATRGQYTAAQLATITRAMTDPDLVPELSRGKNSTVACNDEFRYTFRFGTADTFNFDQCPSTPPAVAALIDALGDGTPF